MYGLCVVFQHTSSRSLHVKSNITLFLEKMISLYAIIMRELKCACNPILYHIQTFHTVQSIALSLSLPNSSPVRATTQRIIFNDNSSSSFGSCDHHSPPPEPLAGDQQHTIHYIHTNAFTCITDDRRYGHYIMTKHIALWKTTVPTPCFSNLS